jgi:hypothetical protein
MDGSAQRQFNLEVDGSTYELGEAEFAGILFEVVATLVFEKLVDRVSYILEAGERELCGSGGSHFDALCVSLYRHLKEERYRGPSYDELGGETQSFRLRGIADGLVAVAFFLKAGETVPHFIVGRPDADPLCVLDRGRRTRLAVDDPTLKAKLTRLIPR